MEENLHSYRKWLGPGTPNSGAADYTELENFRELLSASKHRAPGNPGLISVTSI